MEETIEKPIQVGQVLDLVVIFTDEDDEAIPIDDATDLKIRLEGPDGTAVEFSGADVELETDGLDGAAVYRTAAADIPEAGRYRAQGFCTKDGVLLKTQLGVFWAREDIEVTP